MSNVKLKVLSIFFNIVVHKVSLIFSVFMKTFLIESDLTPYFCVLDCSPAAASVRKEEEEEEEDWQLLTKTVIWSEDDLHFN